MANAAWLQLAIKSCRRNNEFHRLISASGISHVSEAPLENLPRKNVFFIPVLARQAAPWISIAPYFADKSDGVACQSSDSVTALTMRNMMSAYASWGCEEVGCSLQCGKEERLDSSCAGRWRYESLPEKEPTNEKTAGSG